MHSWVGRCAPHPCSAGNRRFGDLTSPLQLSQAARSRRGRPTTRQNQPGKSSRRDERPQGRRPRPARRAAFAFPGVNRNIAGLSDIAPPRRHPIRMRVRRPPQDLMAGWWIDCSEGNRCRPCERRTHTPRPIDRTMELVVFATTNQLWLWVPAFAGDDETPNPRPVARMERSAIREQWLAAFETVPGFRFAPPGLPLNALILDPVAMQVVAVGVEPALGAFDMVADAADDAPEPG